MTNAPLPDVLAAALAHPDAAAKKAAAGRWKKEAGDELQGLAKSTLKAGIGNQIEGKAHERIVGFAGALEGAGLDFDVARFAGALSRLVKLGQSYAVTHDPAFARAYFEGCLDKEKDALNLYDADLELTHLPAALVDALPALHKKMPFTELFLHGLPLEDLPAGLAWLAPHLKRLNLNDAQLTELPPVVWRLTALEELSLYIHPLARLSEDIAALTRLKSLHIGEARKLKQLPAAVFGLPLEELHIFKTGITALPGLARLTTLRTLDVRAPGLKSLPGVEALQELKSLTLHGSKLTTLPDAVYELPKLKKLSLCWTQINIGTVKARLPKRVELSVLGGVY